MTRKNVLTILIVLAVVCLLVIILFPKTISFLGSYILLLTLLAIVFYSWETSQLRIQSKRQIELAQEQMELSLKPQLEIVFQRAHFRLYNVGNGPAVQVRIDDKIVSPARYPVRLRFICPSIIEKDECLPIELKVLKEDGSCEDGSTCLGFITPPLAMETYDIKVRYENLMGKPYDRGLKIGKDMSIDSTPVDFLLQYLFEKSPKGINPKEISALYVKPEDLRKHLQYCFEKGLTKADHVADRERIEESSNLRISSDGIDYLKGRSQN